MNLNESIILLKYSFDSNNNLFKYVLFLISNTSENYLK